MELSLKATLSSYRLTRGMSSRENCTQVTWEFKHVRDELMKPSTGQECTEIEEYISKCSVCNAYQHKQQKEPIIQHPVPARPWQFVAADLFEFHGKEYLVTMDYCSNFFEVDKLSSQTSRKVIDKLKCQMARHGIPDTLRSDNGPQFSSQEFRKFLELYEFDHTTSSPAYPQSNGKAENSVKTASLIMLKALEAESDPYLGLLDFRNTPTEGLGMTPAQRLFGR